MTHEPHDELERRQFVAPPEVLAELGMDRVDLADPYERSFMIRHEHPEFGEALDDQLAEIDLGYGPINPRASGSGSTA